MKALCLILLIFTYAAASQNYFDGWYNGVSINTEIIKINLRIRKTIIKSKIGKMGIFAHYGHLKETKEISSLHIGYGKSKKKIYLGIKSWINTSQTSVNDKKVDAVILHRLIGTRAKEHKIHLKIKKLSEIGIGIKSGLMIKKTLFYIIPYLSSSTIEREFKIPMAKNEILGKQKYSFIEMKPFIGLNINLDDCWFFGIEINKKTSPHSSKNKNNIFNFKEKRIQINFDLSYKF